MNKRYLKVLTHFKSKQLACEYHIRSNEAAQSQTLTNRDRLTIIISAVCADCALQSFEREKKKQFRDSDGAELKKVHVQNDHWSRLKWQKKALPLPCILTLWQWREIEQCVFHSISGKTQSFTRFMCYHWIIFIWIGSDWIWLGSHMHTRYNQCTVQCSACDHLWMHNMRHKMKQKRRKNQIQSAR